MDGDGGRSKPVSHRGLLLIYAFVVIFLLVRHLVAHGASISYVLAVSRDTCVARLVTPERNAAITFTVWVIFVQFCASCRQRAHQTLSRDSMKPFSGGTKAESNKRRSPHDVMSLVPLSTL
ncbi:hypothetical protein BOTBODRAFT_33096 [Botryobasidium botryosum FD-172 SS1]|uniref:Uncharacterized protein n=1 Tax=Botryobasidium botryosum (strain FD-172 SS1) TaxID=930990 RepID=A0A067MGZ5_BOTB1|nr:hypothetical protein BOTBODRAFT_33096 [Botryobasidium botryosum FD-172 SS1]